MLIYPLVKQLSMRAIAKKVGIAKTTVIERLSGRHQGSGHIAGGARKLRVMSKGTQVGHQMGHFNHFNHFNWTLTWIAKRVIKQVSCLVVCTTDPLDNTTFMPSFWPEQEDDLYNVMMQFAWWGFPFTDNKLCVLAYELASRNNRRGFSPLKSMQGDLGLRVF